MSIISAKDLCLWYGNFQALKNINIEIPERSITALIGPSGCGKSTVLKTISGLMHPRSGSIQFDGHEIAHMEAHKLVRRGLAQVPEGRRVFLQMSVKENLEMVLELAKKLVRKTRGKVKVRINKLHIRVATNDAAHTALLYGVVIQLVSYLIGYVERHYTSIERRDGDLAVEPDYTTSECSASIDLVFSAKIWRAVRIIIEMIDAYDVEKKRTYRKAALREREQQNKPRFDFKNILTRIRKDHSLWKTNLLSRK